MQVSPALVLNQVKSETLSVRSASTSNVQADSVQATTVQAVSETDQIPVKEFDGREEIKVTSSVQDDSSEDEH